MAGQTCPSCGNELPSELGQHATDLVTGVVTCPHCGADVTLKESAGAGGAGDDYARAEAAPPGRTEGAEAFSGNEDVESLRDELQQKPS